MTGYIDAVSEGLGMGSPGQAVLQGTSLKFALCNLLISESFLPPGDTPS